MSDDAAPPLPPEPADDEHATRLPPQDVPAEQSVLGAMLLSKDATADVAGTLQPADFYRPAHELIYTAALALHDRGEPADAVTVTGELTRRGDIARAGGATYLHTLISMVPTAANAGYYAEIVRERAILRRLVEAGTRIVQMGYSAEGDVDGIVDRAQQQVATAASGAVAAGTEQQAGDLLEAALDSLDPDEPRPAEGLPTGYNELDLILAPLLPGQMTVVAARPSVGKSVVGLDLARHAAIRLGEPAVFWTGEMGRDELMHRLVAAEARVDLTRIRRREVKHDDWGRVSHATARIDRAPLWFDDTPGAGLAHIRALVRRRRPKLLVVDYLGLLNSDQRAENEQVRVAALSRGLKLLARAEQMHVLTLAQLNRGPEQRHDKRPTMADLRGSGAIEQDGDNVLLLHREDMYDKNSPRAGELDVIVAKQRNGPTGTAVLGFQGHYSRATDLGGWAS